LDSKLCRLSILFLRFICACGITISFSAWVTFNSLFEILIDLNNFKQNVHMSFQFSFWDSHVQKRVWKKIYGKILSILFLRFNKMSSRPNDANVESFQFSFWDSSGSGGGRSRRLTGPFQFSFWDSELVAARPGPLIRNFQFSFWDSGSIRLTGWTWLEVCFQFSFWDSYAVALAFMLLSIPFNSLFEIQPWAVVRVLHAGLCFQFSFWDSVIHIFNEWIKNNPPLSILFLRFGVQDRLGYEALLSNFQFSFWDSVLKEAGGDVVIRAHPFNSLFEIQHYIHCGRLSGWQSSYFQFSFWDSAPSMALQYAKSSRSFNSLFEIPMKIIIG